MNAKMIAWLLAVRYSSPFRARRQLVVVPNVSWSLLPWEADLLVCSKSGYLTEVEIKVSFSDWRIDILKPKHRMGPSWSQTAMVKRMYYAAPLRLALRHKEIEMPSGAGVIGVEDDKVTMIKAADDRPGFRKLTDVEMTTLLRLAAIKAWGLSHGPELPPPLPEAHPDECQA